MKTQLSTNEAINALLFDEYAGWTHAGARALVEFLEDLEADLGSIDFDPVALRCEFSEYETEEDALEAYGKGIIAHLQDQTTVIAVEGGGVIVADF